MRASLGVEISDTTKDGGSEFSGHFISQVEIDAYIDRHFSIDETTPTANDAIDGFIDGTDHYADGRWTSMPVNPSDESALYAPVTDIVSAILDHFGLSSDRKVYNAHSTDMPHVQGSNSKKKLKTRPDIPMMGIGRSMCRQRELPEKPSYSQCLSWVECKVKRNSRHGANEIQQATYARECSIQSNNRHFIHALIMTEESVQIWRFDRCGATHSDWINIHENPRNFVRIILGISLLDEKFLGYDTSIFWEGDKRYIRTKTRDGSFADYEIFNDGQPFFFHRTLQGRATVCWKVMHEGRVYVVKDLWQASSRTPEYELLEEVRGMDGVGQIVTHDEAVERTVSSMREVLGLDLMVGGKPLSDRAFRRVILECYGSTIDRFHSRSELLHAFHDAVAGHRNLWRKGILHRDVSIHNILLGDPHSSADRGLLIDVDLAALIDRTSNENLLDHRTGTWAFRSITVLLGKWRHDHLDDLESFYYVLCWICFSFCGPHDPVAKLPEFLSKWEIEDGGIAGPCKCHFLVTKFNRQMVPAWFGDIFRDLLSRLHNFCRQRYMTKEDAEDDIRHAYSPKDLLRGDDPLGFKADDDYAEYLRIIKAALDKLHELSNDPMIPSPPSTPVPPTRPSMTSTRTTKTSVKQNRKWSSSTRGGDGDDYQSNAVAHPPKRSKTVPRRASSSRSQSKTAVDLAEMDSE